ncbi:MAG: peptidylprolyl isomerase, partial [Rubrivivax sp.]
VTFVDDAGYTETFSPAAVMGRTRNAAAPTVSISAEDLSLSDGETTVVEFKLSDASTNFIAADVTVIGGTLTDFSGSGDRYTAVFTLTSKSATAALSVNGGRFSNAEGLFNEDGGDNDNRLSFVPPTAPKLVSDPSLEVPSRPLVRVDTTVGSFDISLRPDKAPASVANLLAYVEDGYYEDTLFHRVVQGFVVQGGGFVAGPQYKTPTYAPIVLESDNGLSNTRGTVAMARTNDPNSATSQFYVNLVDNDALDRTSASAGYTVFGEVVSGLEVIDAIAATSVGSVAGLTNVPTTDIVITSATQTAPGLARGPSALLTLTDLEPGGTWQYSLDAGDTWRAGVGSALAVPEGRYDLGDILVRQTDAAGNLSPDVNRFGMALEVDDPDTGQVQVLAWGWRSHALVEGVQLSTVVQAPVQTDAQGTATLRGGLDPLLNVTATLSPSAGQAQADTAAVTLQDAVAILKMIAGQPVNPGGAAVSPFQSLAADVDADGHVGLGDALAVLRHAVGQAALAPSWAFVDERDTTLAARPVREPGTAPALQVPVDPAASAPAHLGLVAVLRGDVDGSHAGAPGAAALEAAHPGYLDALIDDLGVSASRFGVYPV